MSSSGGHFPKTRKRPRLGGPRMNRFWKSGRVRFAAAGAVALAVAALASMGGVGYAARLVGGSNISAAAAAQYPPSKVTICHHTHSQKNPFVTIIVSERALPAHLGHGDTVGTCPQQSLTPEQGEEPAKQHGKAHHSNGQQKGTKKGHAGGHEGSTQGSPLQGHEGQGHGQNQANGQSKANGHSHGKGTGPGNGQGHGHSNDQGQGQGGSHGHGNPGGGNGNAHGHEK
jgi:hypothetical protein